jgi:3-oxoacyl-[acyl-carrier-protein] synthase II
MRLVAITGVGVVNALGEGLAAQSIGSAPLLDAKRFSPYTVYAIPTLNWDRMIPKKSDQRQMEPWQKLGVYAAGLALEDSGLKENAALKETLSMIIAAGGGERDYGVDEAILAQQHTHPDPEGLLNERLMQDIRPTLFLAQLSNLLAGNISIVHGVNGASRTFMGEEASGMEALRTGFARIQSNQADRLLVGAAFNAERPDVLLHYELGGMLWPQEFKPVAERNTAPDSGGFWVGSGAGFLVLEEKSVAEQRGAPIYAVLSAIETERGGVNADLAPLSTTLLQKVGTQSSDSVVSGMTGAARVSPAESEALKNYRSVVYSHDYVGNTLEASAFISTCFGLNVLKETQRPVTVTSLGHQRGMGTLRILPA